MIYANPSLVSGIYDRMRFVVGLSCDARYEAEYEDGCEKVSSED